MRSRRKLRGVVVVVAAIGVATSMGVGTAYASGGGGASECSVAGNPSVDPNPGAMIRANQPFGGNGNEGSNPGFNLNGFSGCKP